MGARPGPSCRKGLLLFLPAPGRKTEAANDVQRTLRIGQPAPGDQLDRRKRGPLVIGRRRFARPYPVTVRNRL